MKPLGPIIFGMITFAAFVVASYHPHAVVYKDKSVFEAMRTIRLRF